MALTKTPIIRYQILDSCFRHPVKRYFISDLINHCNRRLAEVHGFDASISRRQILDDIKFMESSEGWSIDLVRHKVGRKVYYRYADLNYSINNSPLNAIELVQFKAALRVLAAFNGLPQFSWLKNIFEKIVPSLNDNTNDNVVQFDNNENLTRIENIGPIFDAIQSEVVLNVQYRPFGSLEAREFTFHPYYLKSYNNRWFVFGRNGTNGRNDWNLALDRIESMKLNDITPYVSSKIVWSEYFEDIIGVTKPENAPVEKVILHFKGTTCFYVITKPLHGSQKISWLEKENLKLSVRLELIVNKELERLILSYGENVKVIAPDSLRDNIMKQLASAFNQYHEGFDMEY